MTSALYTSSSVVSVLSAVSRSSSVSRESLVRYLGVGAETAVTKESLVAGSYEAAIPVVEVGEDSLAKGIVSGS